MQTETAKDEPDFANGLSVPKLAQAERLEALKLALPADHSPFTDKYFLRTNEILKAEGLNPFVRMQVFIRKGPGEVAGIEEALAMIEKYSELTKHGGRVLALEEGAQYGPKDTLMLIEGPIQDIIELETMYLGAITAATTRANDAAGNVDLQGVTARVEAIRDLIGGRPIMYFGARHWHYSEDAQIARAAHVGGASSASTDVGAGTFGALGAGTIPHALENIFAWKYGKENAVKESTRAFDRVIDPAVPRIALIDYKNREIDDSIATARALGPRLSAVRVDTCGENVAQGAWASNSEIPDSIKSQLTVGEEKYWTGRGVTISGVAALRRALDDAGFRNVGIVLTSGFGDAKKVAAFVNAEKILGLKLFDSLGIGGLYEPCRMATSDIVAVADSLQALDSSPLSKVGRPYRENPLLEIKLPVNG